MKHLLLATYGVLLGMGLMVLTACAPATPPPPPTLDPQSGAGRGLILFRANCASCHALEEDVTVAGPSLAHIAPRAGSRIKGLSAQDYLYESIIAPDRYVVEGFQTHGMRQDFATALTSDEVHDLVAFLMTLQ